MDGLEGIVLSEASQKERQILYDIIYKYNLKKCNKPVNKQKRSILPDIQNKVVVINGKKERRKRDNTGIGGKGRS